MCVVCLSAHLSVTVEDVGNVHAIVCFPPYSPSPPLVGPARFCLSHPFVKLKVVKRWCLQILEGLVYLHSLTPPVIHRDIKCENMLYNSADGTITIGDLGLATRANVEGTVDGGVSGMCALHSCATRGEAHAHMNVVTFPMLH